MGRTPLARRRTVGNCVRVDNPVALLALALVTIFIGLPLIRGIAEAVSSGDAWTPYEAREDGRDGVLAPGRYFSALRAPRGGTRSSLGLFARWAFWVGIAVVLGGGAAYNAFVR